MRQVSGAFSTPPVVLNLLIINVLVFMAQTILPTDVRYFIIEKFGLFFWKSSFFMPFQYITYMFLHADLSHLFFNMFALWMFGRFLEHDLGSKRFILFYLVCGVGAGIIQSGVIWMGLDPANAAEYIQKINTPMIGASGAVFGILLGFGLMHPNSIIMLLIPPIPMKAKYFVILYGVIELLAGVRGSADGIAHFAHVGGLLWGFMLLWWWKKRGKIYY